MASPEESAALLVAWRQFTEHGTFETGVPGAEIAASWARSRGAGLDPRAPKVPVRLSPTELASVRSANRVLLDVALPIMRFLETAVRGSGCILVMTDANGIVLEAFGDATIMKSAAENNYVPGCCRTEEEVGTNAIGLALKEQKPFQLTGAEHYNVRHHRWTCASAPVFGAGGALLGTVTLSGESVAAHRHTLGMVIAAAEAISQKLEQRLVEIEKNRATNLLTSVLKSVSEAIIAVDGAGIVTNMTPEAARMLGVRDGECTGLPVARLFPGARDLAEVITARRSTGPIAIALDSTRGGGSFFVKPYLLQGGDEGQGAILVVSERRAFIRSVREISGGNALFTFDHIVGKHPAHAHQVELARAAARQDSRVLITGETGTGKELIAQAIHNGSSRRNGPFVAINCAAIPRELIESELMGYREGAFSGARKGGQMGKLEFADGGTIFLDEIGQMPVDLQSKLLRVLQDSVVTRLGDTKSTRVDIRVIAATNENLFAKSGQGGFRQDLYFRLSVVEINLPPLRDRADDIPLLADHVLHRISEKCERKGIGIADSAMELLCRYSWPGNIRELENIIEMAVILCDGNSIEPRHFHARLREQLEQREMHDEQPAVRASPTLMKDVEIDLLKSTMKELNGNVALVSRKLGISRSTIYRRMREHGIRRLFGVG
jgi:transcriptional regulator of acetoin/glycerol metabolism